MNVLLLVPHWSHVVYAATYSMDSTVTTLATDLITSLKDVVFTALGIAIPIAAVVMVSMYGFRLILGFFRHK